jgi:hypothetical protein
MGDDDRAELAGMSAYWYSARSLGQYLELYDEDRERLKAWMIEAVDVTKEQREAINKVKHRKAQERHRRKNGAKPHELSASRTKPWELEGFNCRRTWERNRKAAAVSQKRDGLLYLRNEKSRTCDSETPQAGGQVRDGLLLVPSLPQGWPYCAKHIVGRDGNQRVRTLQERIGLSGSNHPKPATWSEPYREAA